MAWENSAAGAVEELKTGAMARSAVLGGFFVSTREVWRLEERFSQVRREFVPHSKTAFCVIVEGTPRPLCAEISEEIWLIGYEALSNAFRHSYAREIEVELEYAATHLRILVRDNGCGIDPEILSSRQLRHWGLCDMKARANRIGARLRVLSRAAAGTEIELTVPAKAAYEWGMENEAVRWLSRIFS